MLPTRYKWLNGHALYDPETARLIAQHLANGHSLRGAAGSPQVNLPLSTIYHWLDTIPDFQRQIDIAQLQRVHQLELRVLNTKDGVQAKVLLQALRRANPEAWDDPRTTPHQHITNELPTQITISAAPPHTQPSTPPSPAPHSSTLQ